VAFCQQAREVGVEPVVDAVHPCGWCEAEQVRAVRLRAGDGEARGEQLRRSRPPGLSFSE
jgi:hypothetical protein